MIRLAASAVDASTVTVPCLITVSTLSSIKQSADEPFLFADERLRFRQTTADKRQQLLKSLLTHA
jgi:hypothetical protein